MKKFMLVSTVEENDYFFWRPSVIIRISTVKLPLDHGYETCVFFRKSSNVAQTYETLQDAIEGHVYWATHFGAKYAKMDLTRSINVV